MYAHWQQHPTRFEGNVFRILFSNQQRKEFILPGKREPIDLALGIQVSSRRLEPEYRERNKLTAR